MPWIKCFDLYFINIYPRRCWIDFLHFHFRTLKKILKITKKRRDTAAHILLDSLCADHLIKYALVNRQHSSLTNPRAANAEKNQNKTQQPPPKQLVRPLQKIYRSHVDREDHKQDNTAGLSNDPLMPRWVVTCGRIQRNEPINNNRVTWCCCL